MTSPHDSPLLYNHPFMPKSMPFTKVATLTASRSSLRKSCLAKGGGNQKCQGNAGKMGNRSD